MAFVENLLYMNNSFFGFWGYVAVFFAVFLESFPFLGSFIPGGIILLLVCGFLAKLGYFGLWEVSLVAIFASICIDSFGYWLGRSRRRGFLHRRSKIFLIKHSTIERVVRIVHGHTLKSLIFGRMNPVTRAIAPFVVGNERVGFGKFFLGSFIGSLIWVVCFVFLGYIFGGSYEVIVRAERYVLWVCGILIGGFYFYYLGNLFREFFGRKVNG